TASGRNFGLRRNGIFQVAEHRVDLGDQLGNLGAQLLDMGRHEMDHALELDRQVEERRGSANRERLEEIAWELHALHAVRRENPGASVWTELGYAKVHSHNCETVPCSECLSAHEPRLAKARLYAFTHRCAAQGRDAIDREQGERARRLHREEVRKQAAIEEVHSERPARDVCPAYAVVALGALALAHIEPFPVRADD